MSEQSEQKFMELSPVMELIFSQLTNMVKYLDLYAGDIDATKLEQYEKAKKGLTEAIRAFEEIYGVSATEQSSKEPLDLDEDEEELEDEETPVVTTTTPKQPATDFASGNDEASLQKAKQAVEELKSLFADMKKSEQQENDPGMMEEVKPTDAMTMPVAPPPVPQDNTPVMSTTPVTQSVMPPQQSVAQPAPGTEPLPTPMAPAQQQNQADASEIDSILAELRKLQNKGGQL